MRQRPPTAVLTAWSKVPGILKLAAAFIHVGRLAYSGEGGGGGGGGGGSDEHTLQEHPLFISTPRGRATNPNLQQNNEEECVSVSDKPITDQ